MSSDRRPAVVETSTGAPNAAPAADTVTGEPIAWPPASRSIVRITVVGPAGSVASYARTKPLAVTASDGRLPPVNASATGSIDPGTPSVIASVTTRAPAGGK